MTERLYFKDAYLTEFESQVIACTPVDDRFEVSLAATAFYPTGGGQPHDLGVLGERSVLDVVDRDQAGIVHIVDGPIEAGARAKGVVACGRRFDHMQQHSGQHILSAAFELLSEARTESFHLGMVSCTIDLNRVLSAEEIAAAEGEANRVVWQDREVRLRFASGADAAALPLRKEPGREGILRLIEVDGFDLSACGGTHVTRAGAIGIIAVTGWEKFKGGTRVEFLCGGRALGRIREWRDVFSATSRILSVLPQALAPAIERLQADNKALGRTVRDVQNQLAVHVATELVQAGESAFDGRVVVARVLEDWDVAGLKAIATAAVASPGVCAALFSASVPAHVVIAHAPGVNLDSAAVVRALLTRFGGKGGGRAEIAQGGGLSGDTAEMVTTARELLTR